MMNSMTSSFVLASLALGRFTLATGLKAAMSPCWRSRGYNPRCFRFFLSQFAKLCTRSRESLCASSVFKIQMDWERCRKRATTKGGAMASGKERLVTLDSRHLVSGEGVVGGERAGL